MKKKIALTVIFICSVFIAAYAQQFNIKRYYKMKLVCWYNLS
ncbi:hypothetical protein [Treponema vincentii]